MSKQAGFWRRTGEYLGLSTSRPQARAGTSSGPESGVIPPARDSGTGVSVETALSVSAVYRAVSVIVTAVAQMPLAVYRNGRQIDTPSLVARPNALDLNTPASGLVEETVYSLAAYGEAFWRVYRAAPGGPTDEAVSLEVLDPVAVGVNKDPGTGRVTYSYNGTELARHRVRHLKLIRRPGHARGLGPLQAAAREIRAVVQLRRYADEWFDTTGVPAGYIKTDQVINAEQAHEQSVAWAKFVAEHKVPVLGRGSDFVPVLIDPAKAQYVEVQRESVVNIARLFGMPARLLLASLDGSSETYTNQESENIAFLQMTLSRYMNEIENAFSDLLPRGQRVEFEEPALLRMDTKTKAEVEAIQVKNNLRSADELREKDKLPPLSAPTPTEEPAP